MSAGVRDVLRGIVLAVMVLAMIGTTLALRASATDQPYTLTRDGIELAVPLEDNGHLNVRTDAGVTYNLHAEAKCVTRTDAECAGQRHEVAQYIGATHIPWSVIGVPNDACAVWVQRSGEDYHYGEHGEPPYCLTEEEPCPSPSDPTEPTPWTPTTDPTTEPTTPAPSASPIGSPSPSVSPTPDPSPTSPEPSASPEPTPSTDPTTDPTAPEPPFDGTNGDPSGWPENYNEGDDEPVYTSEVSAVDEPTTPPAELAATGANAWGFGITAAIALILGTYLVLFARRRGERCPQCGGPLEAITRTHPVHGDWDGVTCRDCFWTEVR